MTTRPILFSGPMVRAILVGHKTQTRRVISPQPSPPMGLTPKPSWMDCGVEPERNRFGFHDEWGEEWWSRYGGPGDRLWVRETFSAWFSGNHWYEMAKEFRTHIYASNVFYRANHKYPDDDQKWVPSIHMPRWASRITLEITEVRVQRVQDISEVDASAEGVGPGYAIRQNSEFADVQTTVCVGYRPMFRRLWNECYTKPGITWDANPWVWAITFRRLQ